MGILYWHAQKIPALDESVFLRSIIVDDVGEQADNGQYAENDFA